MECSSRQRSVPLKEVLTLLESEFTDAERDYQNADLDTASEEVVSEEDTLDNQLKITDEEEGNNVSHGELVETESSFENRTEHVKVDVFFSQYCGCKLRPHRIDCSSVYIKESGVQKKQLPANDKK